MPGRYEIVDEPVETLEVVDDEVYHRDLTMRDTASASFRSLDPIIGGPITLKTIFYDPRWSANKRRCCILFVAITSFVCFSLMIALFVGLGRVLSYINETERLKQTGLHMIPDLDQSEFDMFLYSTEEKFQNLRNKYVKELDDYLSKYNTSDGYQNCENGKKMENGKPCRFDINWLGSSCTSAKKYGYDDGNPCILFALRNVKDWSPNITPASFENATDLPIELQTRMRNGQKFDADHLPLTCSISYPTGPKTEADFFKYFPESGFNLTFLKANGAAADQLPPLVFVQFVKPPYRANPQMNVKCQIWAPNVSNFMGLKIIEFEFDNTEEQNMEQP